MEILTILTFIVLTINSFLMLFLLRELKIKQKIAEELERSRPSKVEVVKYKTQAQKIAEKSFNDLNDIDKELVTNISKNYRDN